MGVLFGPEWKSQMYGVRGWYCTWEPMALWRCVGNRGGKRVLRFHATCSPLVDEFPLEYIALIPGWGELSEETQNSFLVFYGPPALVTGWEPAEGDRDSFLQACPGSAIREGRQLWPVLPLCPAPLLAEMGDWVKLQTAAGAGTGGQAHMAALAGAWQDNPLYGTVGSHWVQYHRTHDAVGGRCEAKQPALRLRFQRRAGRRLGETYIWNWK